MVYLWVYKLFYLMYAFVGKYTKFILIWLLGRYYMYPVYMETQSDPFFTGLQHNGLTYFLKEHSFFIQKQVIHKISIATKVCMKLSMKIKFLRKEEF